MEHLISNFSLEQINKGGSVVNQQKLLWLNSQHIRRRFEEEDDGEGGTKRAATIAAGREALGSFLEQAGHTGAVDPFSDAYVWAVMSLMQERVQTMPDFGPLCGYFFVAPDFASPLAAEVRAKVWSDHEPEGEPGSVPSSKDVMKAILDGVMNQPVEQFSADSFIGIAKGVAKRNALKPGKGVLSPLRYTLTGMGVGGALGTTAELLGRERVLARLEGALRPGF